MNCRDERITIREIIRDDFDQLLQLYEQLNSPIPEKTSGLSELWNTILNDESYHIVIAEQDGKLLSSCMCTIIPNLTHNQKSYALIENVVTDIKYRKRGLATMCLNYAKEIARKNNCYKIMLMTGSKRESTLQFYRQAGYNSEDKIAFIQWL